MTARPGRNALIGCLWAAGPSLLLWVLLLVLVLRWVLS